MYNGDPTLAELVGVSVRNSLNPKSETQINKKTKVWSYLPLWLPNFHPPTKCISVLVNLVLFKGLPEGWQFWDLCETVVGSFYVTNSCPKVWLLFWHKALFVPVQHFLPSTFFSVFQVPPSPWKWMNTSKERYCKYDCYPCLRGWRISNTEPRDMNSITVR